MTKSIVLLSGGLDSVVSLGLTKEKYNVDLALIFDYGQKSAEYEISAAKAISDYYNIELKIIKLDWLKNITQTALVGDEEIPSDDRLKDPECSAKAVWVPNRNGLFLNVAACFADSFGYDYIIIGANKEEGKTFPDNSVEFIENINQTFKFSTLKHPKVLTPLIDYDKNEIVKQALEHVIPLDMIRSCYGNTKKHCGKCESCIRLKKALLANGDNKYIKILFYENTIN